MTGNTRLESVSATSSEPAFSGAYTNGKRGAVGGSLDRTGSFREGGESRGFSSGFGVTRGGSGSNGSLGSGSLHSLSHCLSLEPIPVGERKTDRLAEVRRVMGLFVGSSGDDSSSGVGVSGNSKPSAPVAVGEDLKRLRSSFVDTCNTARGRASKLDEHLNKLDKYCDGVMSKKPQRNELMTSDQAGVLNSKIGTQIHRNSTELVNQRVEDRPKNVLLNKRVRTSVAETRAEFRVNSLRRQPISMAKDRDLLKDGGGESDILEDKIHRLPAVGEGWDKKMKRKRSVGAGFTRPIDSNGDVKRTAQNKVGSEQGLLSKDAQPCRLGASNGSGSTHKVDNKLEGPSLPHGSRARMSPRNEPEGPTKDLSAGSNKEKVLTKGNNKLNTRDDNTARGNLVIKGKASRTPRNGSMVAASSSPSNPHLLGTPESWENVTSGSKIPSTGGTNNRKRAVPSGSSSPSMAQWVGQRPQKISRTRRANLVSPVLNQEGKPLSPDSCSQSDISVRVPSDGTNGPLVSKQFKPKQEPVQSPHRLSESEEFIGGQNVGPSLATAVKVKAVTNEENGEGVKRQGHNGRGPLIVMASFSPTGEKLDNVTMVKPVRSNRPGCEKNGSKSGRPLKKLSDRKGFSRPGHLQNNVSDSTPTGNDDREELLASANHARNASYLACSSAFWKKMEPIFAPVSSRDKLYLSHQLKEHGIQESFHQLPGRENNIAVNLRAEASVFNTNACGERNGHVKHHGSESFSGRLDSDKTSKEFIPLFQRVLSALIIEDTIDELEEDTGNISFEDSFCDSAYDTCQLDGYDPRKRARREAEDHTMFQSVHSVKVSFSSNGSFRNPSINGSPCEDLVLAGISKNFINRPQVVQMEGFGISSFDNQYEHKRLDEKLLLELHSIGLYPELVPKLDNKDDEAIKHEIDQLKTRLQQQNYKKKACLERICEGVGRSSLGRNLEQLALDRLVELAYRKLLATRGPSRGGILKIPKHVALAFGRRTLAKCRKFGKSGVSCFNVPPLRDILYAPHENELEPPVSTNTTTRYIGFQNPHPDSRISSDEAFAINGPISNSGKKKELLLDDVGTVFGGTMGKRAYPGDKKTNPKQKAGQPPTPGNGYGNQSTRSLHPVQPSLNGLHHNGNDTRRDIRTMSHPYGLQEMSKESREAIDPLHDLDPIDELGVDTELGGPQDLSSLLNFDEEDLQDHYSAGLEIPMDDLTELNMF